MRRKVSCEPGIMKRSPRRPLILKRRKLPFQRNDQPAAAAQSKPDEARGREAPKPSTEYGLPDGVRIMDHPTMRDTQVVVMPRKDLQNVIGALTAKGRECGPHGPTKFILLSESSFREKDASTERSIGKELAQSPQGTKPPTGNKPLIKEPDSNPLDDSLTNIQWLGTMNTDGLGSGTAKDDEAQKENVDSNPQMAEVSPSLQDNTEADVHSKKPPYSYMVMIQFAINSKPIRRMTLKEIYAWIEDHFPYFRHAKPGWKNSIRHNLSLHNMFVRDTAADNRVSYWTIRPEANRCLTLDQVYKPGCDLTPAPLPVPLVFYPCQRQNREAPVMRRSSSCFERRIKPLLPRADSYLVPIQLPVASSYYLHPPPSSSRSPLRPYARQRTRTSARGSRRVRIAPKVSPSSAPPLKEGQRDAPPLCPHPRRRGTGSSRRKQVLVRPQRQEEPVLLAHSTLLDSGVVSDISSCQDLRDTDQEQEPSLNFSFKTPIKGGCRLTSSTPSRPAAPSGPWREAGAALSEEARALLDFSPIRTPSGPAVTPQRPEYHTYSFSTTPFKDLPLFSSPGELLLPPPASPHSPACSRELLRANRSLTEGLVLDTVNDSLSKVLVDISFSGLEDEELSMANISWSQFLPLLK